MSEKHFIHKDEPVPFSCEDCEHFINGVKCKAFDPIPVEYIVDAEAHNKVNESQTGDFVFITRKERQYNRVYVVE